MSFRAEPGGIGRAAFAALSAGPATVFAAFERSCYVENSAGIACLGGRDLGRGPLNAILADFAVPAVGERVRVEYPWAPIWQPAAPGRYSSLPRMAIPEAIRPQAQAFLDWLAGRGEPDDTLIGLGPGLTPAGDDFVGGAMIALRAFGETAGRAALAERVAAWALPLAQARTSRISRAHLECAAAGEGHEALHDFLDGFGEEALARLARLGHSSGLDAAAGALLALRRQARSTVRRPGRFSRHLAHLRRTFLEDS
jgi:hypothetical protein